LDKLLIHIGTEKAGSTSIQAILKKYQRSEKRTRGFSIFGSCGGKEFGYIKGKGVSAGLIMTQYMPIDQWPRLLRRRYLLNKIKFKKDCKFFQRIIRKCIQKERYGVLSSEYLCLLNIEQVSKLRSDLEILGAKDFQILVYVRDPVSFYRSSIQQNAKYSTDFSSYNPYEWRYPFKRFIETWQSVFLDKVVVRPFDRTKLLKECVVQDFFRELSSYFGLTIEPEAVVMENQTLTTEVLFILQDLLKMNDIQKYDNLNRLKRLGKLRQRLVNAGLSLPSTPLQLQPWVPRIIWENHQTQLDWLRSRFGIGFKNPLRYRREAVYQNAADFSNRLDQLVVPPGDQDVRGQLMLELLSDIIISGFSH